MKIAIIGNAAGGKTQLSYKLSKHLNIPATHVDSIQFLPGMKIQPHAETSALLTTIAANPKWIIDGYGPLNIIEERFRLADQIIFIDLPISRHYFWLLKRQIKSIFKSRSELPAGCSERSLKHTIKVLKSMRSMHKQMRPEILRILNRNELKPKVIHLKTVGELKKAARYL